MWIVLCAIRSGLYPIDLRTWSALTMWAKGGKAIPNRNALRSSFCSGIIMSGRKLNGHDLNGSDTLAGLIVLES